MSEGETEGISQTAEMILLIIVLVIVGGAVIWIFKDKIIDWIKNFPF